MVFGDVAGDGFGAGSGIACEGSHGGVPGAGEKHGQVGAVFGGVGEGGVAELVEGPPGVSVEEVSRRAVGKPGPAGFGVDGEGRHSPGGQAFGEKDGPAVPPAKEAGQELGGAGLPEHPVDGAPLGADAGPLVGEVEIAESRARISPARAAVS